MDTGLQELKNRLIETDEEFSRLSREHTSHAQRLEQLTSKPFLTDPEQVEEINLKKRKLFLKDQMEKILQRHKKESYSTP